MDAYEQVNETDERYFEETYPARTTVGPANYSVVPQLPSMRSSRSNRSERVAADMQTVLGTCDLEHQDSKIDIIVV